MGDHNDIETARSAAQRGAIAAGLLALLSVWGSGFSTWSFVDAGLFAVLGVLIYRMSRAAAVSLALSIVGYAYSFKSDSGGSVALLVFAMGFVSGVRGTLAFHRLRKQGAFDPELIPSAPENG